MSVKPNGLLDFRSEIPLADFTTIGNYSVSTYSAELGVGLTRYINTPFKMSAGIGYSRIGANSLGYPYSRDYERADNAVFSLGLEDMVKIGLGLGLNWTSSNYQYAPSQNLESSTAAYSYGAILQAPLAEIIAGRREESDRSRSSLLPIADFTIAYAMKDMGNDVNNSSLFSRQGDLGINFELGVESRFDGHKWKLLSVILAREADEQLIRTDSSLFIENGDSAYIYSDVYTGSIRHMSPYRNIVLGRSGGRVGVRSGLQVQAAEFLYIRLGSADGQSLGGYSTFGFGIRLIGLMRLLCLISNNPRPQGLLMSALTDHVDLEYDYSRMTNWNGGPTFNELSLLVR